MKRETENRANSMTSPPRKRGPRNINGSPIKTFGDDGKDSNSSYSISRRFLSLLTAFIFTWTTSAGAFLSVPPELAKVSEHFSGPADGVLPRVIHIRDVHMNYGVQKKIETLLHRFSEDSNVRLVGLEAADVDLNPDEVFISDDPEIRYRVADSLAQEGKVNGVELFAIKAPKRIRITGLENRALYQADIAALRTVTELRKEVAPMVRHLRERLEKLELKALPQPVYNILERRRSLKERSEDFLTYLHYLDVASAKAGVEVSTKEFPAIAEVFILENLERFFKDHTRELEEEKQRFTSSFPRKRESSTINFNGSPIKTFGDDEDLDVYLMTHTFDRLRYPKLGAYANYLESTKKVEAMSDQVMQEMRILEERVMQMLMVSTQEMRVVRLEEILSYVEQLLDLTLPREELERAEKFYPRFFYESIGEELAQMEKTFGMTVHSSFPEERIENFDLLIENALQFYQFARERDDAMLERFLAELGKDETGIIVTGGFHSAGISQKLRDAHIPFAVVVPQVDEIEDHESYLKAFLPFGDRSEILAGQSRAGLAALTGSPGTDFGTVFSNRIIGMVRELNLGTEKGIPTSELSSALSNRVRTEVVSTARTTSGIETATLKIYAGSAEGETVTFETSAGGIRILSSEGADITADVISAAAGFGMTRGVKTVVTSAFAAAILQLCNCGTDLTKTNQQLTLPFPIPGLPISVVPTITIGRDAEGRPFITPALNVGYQGITGSIFPAPPSTVPEDAVSSGSLVRISGDINEEIITESDILEVDVLGVPTKARISLGTVFQNHIDPVLSNPRFEDHDVFPSLVKPGQLDREQNLDPLVVAYNVTTTGREIREEENHVTFAGAAIRLFDSTARPLDQDDYLVVARVPPSFEFSQTSWHFVRYPDGRVVLTPRFMDYSNGEVPLVDVKTGQAPPFVDESGQVHGRGELGPVIPVEELEVALDEDGNPLEDRFGDIQRYVNLDEVPDGLTPVPVRRASLAGDGKQQKPGQDPPGWMQTWGLLGQAMNDAIVKDEGRLIVAIDFAVDNLETLGGGKLNLTFIEPGTGEITTGLLPSLNKDDLLSLLTQVKQMDITDDEPDYLLLEKFQDRPGLRYLLPPMNEIDRLELQNQIEREMERLTNEARVNLVAKVEHSQRIKAEYENGQIHIVAGKRGFPEREYTSLIPLATYRLPQGGYRAVFTVSNQDALTVPVNQLFIGIESGSPVLDRDTPDEEPNDAYIKRARFRLYGVDLILLDHERFRNLSDPSQRRSDAAEIMKGVPPSEAILAEDGRILVAAFNELERMALNGGPGLYSTTAQGFGALPETEIKITRTTSGTPTTYQAADGKPLSRGTRKIMVDAIKLAMVANTALCGPTGCRNILSTLPEDVSEEDGRQTRFVVSIGENGFVSGVRLEFSAEDLRNRNVPRPYAESLFPFAIDWGNDGEFGPGDWYNVLDNPSFDQDENGIPDVVEQPVTPSVPPPTVYPPLPPAPGAPPAPVTPGLQIQGVLPLPQFQRAPTVADALASASLFPTTILDIPILVIPGQADSLLSLVDPENPSGAAVYVGWRDGQDVNFAGIVIKFADPDDPTGLRPRSFRDYLNARVARLELAKERHLQPADILDARIAELKRVAEEIDAGHDVFIQFVIEPQDGIRTRGNPDGTGIRPAQALKMEFKLEMQELNLSSETVFLLGRQDMPVGRANAVMLRITPEMAYARADQLSAFALPGRYTRLKRDADGHTLFTPEQNLDFAAAHGGKSLLDVEAGGLWDLLSPAAREAFTEDDPEYLIAENNIREGEPPLLEISGISAIAVRDTELLEPGVVPGDTGVLDQVRQIPPINPGDITGVASLAVLNDTRAAIFGFPPGSPVLSAVQPYNPFDPLTEWLRANVWQPVDAETPPAQAVTFTVQRAPDGFIGEPTPGEPIRNIIFMWKKIRDFIQSSIDQLTQDEDAEGNAEHIRRLTISRDQFQRLIDNVRAGGRAGFEFAVELANVKGDPSVTVKFGIETLGDRLVGISTLPRLETTVRPSAFQQRTTMAIPPSLLDPDRDWGELIIAVTVELGATEIINPDLTAQQRESIRGLTFDEVKAQFPGFIVDNPNQIVPDNPEQPIGVKLRWDFITAKRTSDQQSSTEFSRTKKSIIKKMFGNSPRLTDLWRKAQVQSPVAEKLVLATWSRIRGLGVSFSDDVADGLHVQDQMNREFDLAYGITGESLAQSWSRRLALASGHLKKELRRKSVGTIHVVSAAELDERLRTQKRVDVGRVPVAVGIRNEVTVTPEGLRSLALARVAEAKRQTGRSGAVGFGIKPATHRFRLGLPTAQPSEHILARDVTAMIQERLGFVGARFTAPPNAGSIPPKSIWWADPPLAENRTPTHLKFAGDVEAASQPGIYFLRMGQLTASSVHILGSRLAEGDMVVVGDSGEEISAKMESRLLELRAKYPDLFLLPNQGFGSQGMFDSLRNFSLSDGNFYKKVRTKFPAVRKQSDIAQLLVIGVADADAPDVLHRMEFSDSRVYVFPSADRLSEEVRDQLDDEQERTVELVLGLQSMRRIRTPELVGEALRDDFVENYAAAPDRAFQSTDNALQNLGPILEALEATYAAVGVSA